MRVCPQNNVGARNLRNAALAILALWLVSGCVFNTNRAGEKNVVANAPLPTPEATQSGPPKKTDAGDFVVLSKEAQEPRFAELDAKIKKEKLLEKAADDLNRAFILPSDVFIRTAPCDTANAEYDPNTQTITVCFELFTHFSQLFQSAGMKPELVEKKTFDAVRFAFLHEVGHALIENYKLPVTGGEEDAADRCSAYINIVGLQQPGVDSVIAAADAFRIEAKRSPRQAGSKSDEHLLEEQRSYNSLCMIYGSDPEKYGYFVTDGYLPYDRAVKCPAEFEKLSESWESLLRPWRKRD